MSRKYSFRSLRSHELLARLDERLAHDRSTTAELVALLGEIEGRRLHRPAGYASMFLYCVGKHGMSEDVACHRLRTARAAKRFPAILDMLEDGRLHVSGVSLLAKFLTPENAAELLAAAAHGSRRQIEALLAARFPRADVATVLVPVVAQRAGSASAVLDTAHSTPVAAQRLECPLPAPVRVSPFESANPADLMGPLSDRARVAPLAPERFALQVTLDQETHDLLRYAQSLLGPDVAPGDVAEVLKRALAAYTEKLERQKLGAGTRASRGSDDPRYVPVAVRREVWERDGGQCVFTSAHGHRCEARDGLHFDHVHPVGKGGDGSSAANVRLLCATHNRLEADRAFGEGFMQAKVEAARARRCGAAAAVPEATCSSEDPIATAARDARARGRSPADVLKSHAAATTARVRLDARLAAPVEVRSKSSAVPVRSLSPAIVGRRQLSLESRKSPVQARDETRTPS